MTTTTYGGVVPNKGVNLTCIGRALLAVNDWVEVVANYEVDIPATRGSLSIAGFVLVANKAAGGDITVSSRFKAVDTFVAADAIVAGDPVVITDTGKVSAYNPLSSPGAMDSCCSIVGIALTEANVGGKLDVGIL
jgi:hypothetical protein